jgi:glyoxylase-like metal-dependent hydrolase (beta-lactamase superfamily II)
MKNILPGIHYFTGLIAGRVYLLEDPDGLTLIDASIPPAPKAILRQIKAAGWQPSDIKRILITHAHPDHVGGVPELQKATGAEIWSSEIEKPVVQGDTDIPRVDPAELKGLSSLIRLPPTTNKPCTVQRTLSDGEIMPEIQGGLQAIFTPGHAPGHLSFWHPQKRLLFCGDVLFNLFKLSLPPTFLTVDMAENKRSILKIAQLDPQILCFGHGNPITQDTAHILRTFAQKMYTR